MTMYQLKIYNSEDENIWDEVDGGVEIIEEDAAEKFCTEFQYDEVTLVVPGFADVDESAEEILEFAEEHGGFGDELIEAIEDVRDHPEKYADTPFCICSYED